MQHKLITLPETQLVISPALAPALLEHIIIQQLCLNDVQRQDNPGIFLFCGPTASGKTTFTKNICAYLEENHIPAVFFSTDNYYKGITRMVFDPLLETLPVEARTEILNSIRGIIIQNKFLTEKGSSRNCKIFSVILEQYGILFSPKEIQVRFENINFDDPRAIDIPLLIQHLAATIHREPFDIPHYDMKLSEPIPSEKRFTGKETAIIIEGITAFDERLLPWATSRVFIDVPESNLIVRRIRRDIFKNPTNFTAEQLLKYLLTKALPAYQNTILPTRKYANIIIKNPLSLREANNTQIKEYQAKVAITSAEAEQLIIQLDKHGGGKTLKQRDYFLYMADYDKGYLRLREESSNGKPWSLSTLMHIGQKVDGLPKGILYNPVDILVNEKDFSNQAIYANATQVLNDFAAIGISLLCQHEKIRKIYRHSKPLHIDIDLIEGGQCIVSFKVRQNRLKDIPAEFATVEEYLKKMCRELLGDHPFMEDFDPSECPG